MTPADIAARVAAQKAATLARLDPLKREARATQAEQWKNTRELKAGAKDKAAERDLVRGHAFDLFPTPPDLAARMVEIANVGPGQSILEPSAGTGRIATAASNAGAGVFCVEFSYSCAERLRRDFETEHGDFMQYDTPKRFDAVLMNPPFSNGADIDHARHAWQFVANGGCLVAIMSEGAFFRQDRKATAFREWLEEVGGTSEQLPPDTFRTSGTGVNARLVTIRK